jgi:acyl-coenzyme A thioesterase PaaI-like protein
LHQVTGASISVPSVTDASWAGSDFQQPPRTDGGVALCGACRRLGACRLGLTTERLDDQGVAHFRIVCPATYEGGPGVAHGGWSAEVLDEALGHVPILRNQLTVTGTLTVRFVRPVPIERDLEARAWVDRIEGKKWFISGELVLASSGALLTSGTGIWIARDGATHFSGFQRWLAGQDERSDGA